MNADPNPFSSLEEGTSRLFRGCIRGAERQCDALRAATERDLAFGLKFLKLKFPELVKSDFPAISIDYTKGFSDARAGTTEFFSGNVVLSALYNNPAELTGTLAHELLHSYDGILGRLRVNLEDILDPIKDGKGKRHTQIDDFGDSVERSFNDTNKPAK